MPTLKEILAKQDKQMAEEHDWNKKNRSREQDLEDAIVTTYGTKMDRIHQKSLRTAKKKGKSL